MRHPSFAMLGLLLLLNCADSRAQAECDGRQIHGPGPCQGDDIDETERDLAGLINQYRAQNRLPPIALSPALSRVANRHVRDMALNLGTMRHEWSNCQNTRECMWEAPKRLGTGYPGAGYENANSGTSCPGEILESWKEFGLPSRPHNDVILNQAMWARYRWQAMGIGMYRGYAVMWVGQEIDPNPLDSRFAPLPLNPVDANNAAAINNAIDVPSRIVGRVRHAGSMSNGRGGSTVYLQLESGGAQLISVMMPQAMWEQRAGRGVDPLSWVRMELRVDSMPQRVGRNINLPVCRADHVQPASAR